MLKGDIKILLVEDEVTFGATLKEALVRDGFQVLHLTRPDEALSAIKVNSIQMGIYDCMLPKMNGRELARKIDTELGSPLPKIMVSGIFRDRAFVRETIAQTGAKHFLSKPFELKEFMTVVNDTIGHLIDIPVSPLIELLGQVQVSPSERIRAINSSDGIQGFELPWVMSLLMHSQIQGILTVQSAEGESASIGFMNGQIVQVTNQDQKSYFGVLLVEHGFLEQDELDAAMKETDSAKKLGERLVEANLLSPHAISIVMAEQQGIRLGRIISDTTLKIEFKETTEITEDASIDLSMFQEICNDWIGSKFTVDWIKTHYTPWVRNKILKGPAMNEDNRSLASPAVLRAPQLLDRITHGKAIEELQAETGLSDAEFFPALHNLVLGGCIRFGEEVKTTDLEVLKKRLSRLDADLARQNYFERLGISIKSKESEIKRAYHELAKTVHPDRIGKDAPADLKDLARRCFNLIQEAYETLSDKTLRDNYLLELEQGRAEKILEAEQSIEQARAHISKGDIRRAREVIDATVRSVPMTSELRLHSLWVQALSQTEISPKNALKMREELALVPPEDRHNAIYFLVKGLLFKATGEFDMAKRSLEQSLGIDPHFAFAKRELNLLQLQINRSDKPVDLLRGDLKDVLGALLGGKKKKGA